jgi:hypothetical protein
VNFSFEDKLRDLGYQLDSLQVGMKESFNTAVVSVAQGAQQEWTRLAAARLHTSADIYIGGLRQAESYTVKKEGPDGVIAEITLVGVMPNNLEFGMGSFDMKEVRPGWLGGGKAKIGKDGKRYAIIPMRHSTGQSTRFDYTGKAKAVSGPDLKTQLRATVKQYGLDKALTSAMGEVATRRVPLNAPVHPYLQGLQKTEMAVPSGAAKGFSRSSTLTTFRVISENSAPSAWIHPGIKPANLLQEVETWVDKELDRIMETILGA